MWCVLDGEFTTLAHHRLSQGWYFLTYLVRDTPGWEVGDGNGFWCAALNCLFCGRYEETDRLLGEGARTRLVVYCAPARDSGRRALRRTPSETPTTWTGAHGSQESV